MSKNQKGQPKKSSGPLPEWSHVIIPKPAKNIFINGPIIGKGADKITDDAYRRIKFSDLIGLPVNGMHEPGLSQDIEGMLITKNAPERRVMDIVS